MPNAVGDSIIVEIKKALKQFGTYNYYDKGPEEVMDTSLPLEALLDQTPEEIIVTLLQLKEYEDGAPFWELAMAAVDEAQESRPELEQIFRTPGLESY